MCGRFSFAVQNDIQKRFGLTQLEFDFAPRYNIAPSQLVPVVIRQDGGNNLCFFKWGLIPNWAKDASIANKLINARAETLNEKPSFKKSFEQKRCLILADGFYEWKQDGRVRNPYRITLKNGEAFAFAGLWDSWRSPAWQLINTCTIITTTANSLLEPLHQRMPVILPQDTEGVWLDGGAKDNKSDLKSLLVPYSAEQMVACEVSPLVNSPLNDGPECAAPALRLF